MVTIGDDEPRPGEGSAPSSERDVLAARRARRAGIGEAAPDRRAELAEATVRTMESHIADLRRRLLETEREREHAAVQLTEREQELRRAKQREYAEQRLRVEAEDDRTRLRRGHRAELDRLHRRVQEARAAAQRAEEQRAQAEERRARAEQRRASLAARLAAVSESCVRLERSVLALQGAAAELRATLERERDSARSSIQALQSRSTVAGSEIRRLESQAAAAGSQIRELEARSTAAQSRIEELERSLTGAVAAGEPESEEVRREEMAAALAAAVERLRTRVAAVGELQVSANPPDEPPVEAPAREPRAATAIRPKPHKHSMSLIGRWRVARKHRHEGP
jgi:fused signal recognition particle receptor